MKDYLFNKNFSKNQFFNKIFINNFFFYNFNFIKNRNENFFYNFNFYFSVLINKSYLYLTTLKGTYIDDKELRKFKGYLEKRFNNFRFKYYLLKNDNSIIYKIYDLYKNYMFINDFTINHFLINKNFY
mgnify:CR=1 FL=1